MVSDITGMDYKILENNITLETNEISIDKISKISNKTIKEINEIIK